MTTSSDSQQVESRLTKKFCDSTAPHFHQFSPDFKPNVCVGVSILNSTSNNNNNKSLAAQQKIAFSQTVWPNSSSLPADGSVKVDVAASLVSVCNVSGQVYPAPWPSPSSSSAGAARRRTSRG